MNALEIHQNFVYNKIIPPTQINMQKNNNSSNQTQNRKEKKNYCTLEFMTEVYYSITSLRSSIMPFRLLSSRRGLKIKLLVIKYTGARMIENECNFYAADGILFVSIENL